MIKLHLMDDRNVLKSVEVEEDRDDGMGMTNAWLELMVFLENYVDTTPAWEYNLDDLDWKKVKREAAKARNMDITRDNIVGFNSSVFSAVWHEIH